MIKIIKTIVLGILIILCLYQASMMWASQLNSTNSLLPTIGSLSSSLDLLDDEIYLLTPNKLGIVLDGDETKFTVIKKTSVFYASLYKESAAMLIEVMSGGDIYVEDVEVNDLFSSRSLFFTLETEISKDILIDVFNFDQDLLEKVDYITSFGIILSENVDHVFVYLISQDQKATIYAIDSDRIDTLSDSIEFYLDQIQENTNTLTLYDSSIFDDIDGFYKHTLLPTSDNNWGYIKELNFYKPFINIDGFIKRDVENYVNGFEPGAKWDYSQQDRIMYGNDTMLITYDSQGLFQYQLFVDQGDHNSGLVNSFIVANNFIRKDNQIKKQEFYLKNYYATDTGYVFNYGYRYNGFPIIMDSVLLERYGLGYPLVIEVSGNEVVSYERILIAMEDMIPELKTYSGDYRKMLEIFDENVSPTIPITDAFLGYYWSNEDSADMRWIIDYNRLYYSIDM
ncbi:MAG: hypothetical protein PF505_10685 [Vallitaleaceae bacterium]|jgi:hypothetical protein|nr:hypothetical protein [Vallitaleaceae bacterium]